MPGMFGAAEYSFVELILRPTVIGALSSLIFVLAYSLIKGRHSYWRRLRANAALAVGYSVPTVFVAYIAGYLTGTSRASVVGSIVAGILTLLGGLNLYLFGAKAENRYALGYAVFLFVLAFFYAVQVGVTDRELGRVERLIYLSEQEKEIKTYRINRDLSAEPPSWLLGGEPR